MKNEQMALARERNRLAISRTRLANKRTFLAWCRTALAFMTFGFLLEKIDVFLTSGHRSITESVRAELGVLGQLAFIGGPVLMLFAGWRYYRLEKELGPSGTGLFIVPEVVLFGCILCGVLVYVFW
ncbi:DUF202 domain-containing protein [Pseudodesulfovibrio sp. JC047]|uniref:YidH family protein n=1 Tax=Pseudodesulfovibrio sp. JC047 TaxID=2683199 RepID=UPI0013CF4C90|nr:DUF202 domain-containing protein [Pseudodesulfovibrio sp. JC047]NDV19603.1 DUF202 domain-containing protein [Pseudodesulfovibrio sp. JC047]